MRQLKYVNVERLCLFMLLFGGYIKMLLPIISFPVYFFQALSVFSGVIFLLKNDKISYNAFGLYILLGLFAICSLFSTFGYSKIIFIFILKMILYLLAIYGLLNEIGDKNEFDNFINMAIKLQGIVFAIYIVSQFGAIFNMVLNGSRIETAEQNAIWLSRFCNDLILMIFFYNKGKVSLKKGMEIGILLLFAFFTGSKGPLLAMLLVGGVTWMLLYQSRYRGKKLLLIGSVLFLAGVTFCVLQNMSGAFINSRYSIETMLTNSYGYRLHRYLFSLDLIKNKPLCGYGAGSWGTMYGSNYSDYPHNILIQIAFEYGLIFTFVFVLFISGMLLKNAKKIKKIGNIQLVFLVLTFSNFVYAMTSGAIFDGNALLYYYLVILCYFSNKEVEEKV